MKRVMLSIVMVIPILLFAACSAKTDTATAEEKDKQIAELQAQIAEMQARLENAGSEEAVTETNNTVSEERTSSTETESNKVSDERTESNEESKQGQATQSVQVVNIGDSISTDFVELSFDAVKTANEIKPDNPAGVYRYQSDQENETYLYVVGTIKNVSGDSYEFADSSYAKIIFDGKYNYSGSVTADEGGNFSYIYAYLKPFQSEKIYWIFSVPDELIDQYSEATIIVGFNENFKDDWHKSIDTCDYSYKLSVTK